MSANNQNTGLPKEVLDSIGAKGLKDFLLTKPIETIRQRVNLCLLPQFTGVTPEDIKNIIKLTSLNKKLVKEKDVDKKTAEKIGDKEIEESFFEINKLLLKIDSLDNLVNDILDSLLIGDIDKDFMEQIKGNMDIIFKELGNIIGIILSNPILKNKYIIEEILTLEQSNKLEDLRFAIRGLIASVYSLEKSSEFLYSDKRFKIVLNTLLKLSNKLTLRDTMEGVKIDKTTEFGLKNYGLSNEFILELSKGDLKSFFLDLSVLKREGKLTKNKIDSLMFDHFSKEEIEEFPKNIEKLFFKLHDIENKINQLFNEMFNNSEIISYSKLEKIMKELLDFITNILSSPIYTNIYFKDTLGLKQINKIEIIRHKVERIIYNLYHIDEYVYRKDISKKMDFITVSLWETLEKLEKDL